MRYIILVQATDATEAGEMPRPWSWPPGSPRRPAGRRYSPPPWSGSSPRARASSTSSPRPKRIAWSVGDPPGIRGPLARPL